MVVARPVEPTSVDFQTIGSSAPIVPTKLLTDPGELDRTLLQNGICTFDQNSVAYEVTNNDYESSDNNSVDALKLVDLNISNLTSSITLSPINSKQFVLSQLDFDFTLPETARFTVELHKNECGLGITIAGYVCEREDLSGIFVKSLNEGSEAYRCGKININDRIVEVDGESLQDFTNYHAVEKLKQTGDVVKLTLERYLRGPKYEHLQEALACQESKELSPPSPSVKTLSWIPIDPEVGL